MPRACSVWVSGDTIQESRQCPAEMFSCSVTRAPGGESEVVDSDKLEISSGAQVNALQAERMQRPGKGAGGWLKVPQRLPTPGEDRAPQLSEWLPVGFPSSHRHGGTLCCLCNQAGDVHWNLAEEKALPPAHPAALGHFHFCSEITGC